MRRQAQPATERQREAPERQQLDLHRLARDLVAAQRAGGRHLGRVGQLEQRGEQQQVRAQLLHRRVGCIGLRDQVAEHDDEGGRQHGERQRHPHADPGHEPRLERIAFAQRLADAGDQRDAKAERHHEHQRREVERDLVRRNLHHAVARYQQADRAERADLGEVADADRHAEPQHRADLGPVRPFPVRERVGRAVGRRVAYPRQHGEQHHPHAQRGRDGAADSAQGREAPVAEDEQPVDEDVDAQAHDGDQHHRQGLVDAGAVAVQRAVGRERRQADADDVHEQLGLALHVRRQVQVGEQQGGDVGQRGRDQADAQRFPQRLPHRVRDLAQVAGADVVRDDAVDRHHDAADGDQDDRPDRRAQRHRRQLVGAGVAGHGDVGHTHADGGQLADQHGPGQAPQRGGFETDRRQGERVGHRGAGRQADVTEPAILTAASVTIAFGCNLVRLLRMRNL